SEEVASAAMTAAFEQIDELARWLHRQQSTDVWSALDECERLHWRRQAQQRLTAISSERDA
ncbi:hypothetical protein, partial [Mesorhizobium sp. M1C.F.Ca.ET.196.01.1.1]|uniref:hypothetical protein n=1 Tax=Mesorhizobium sp. M1C.F.Ca.ET.196.01.1.1 TaxID=2563928 RepID=UPI001AED1434